MKCRRNARLAQDESMSDTEVKSTIAVLRSAQREADERAREAMREASQLLELSSEIDRKVRELKEAKKR